ncbi:MULTISPECIES: plastocyanin/azurin family copper-binding protein [unclassified Marinomonas]|uniref:plastocyanin/azurin family copper-binding protein n=1 Tax=unclassified Marinomonas TaxID=196814 RepID=UPI000AA213DA|nr:MULTISPECIES: plastocyanin/azurin family copper-binding protein [unclassified Marinomonas]
MYKLVITLLLLASYNLANAADYEIKMLDFGKDKGMVFEPGFLSVLPRDTIKFIPTSSGHFVRSSQVPEGVSPWQSKMDEVFTVTVTKEGVYVYYCPPHLSMAMVGVIQVGEAQIESKDELMDAMSSFNRRHLMNKKRLWTYIEQIEWTKK